MVLPLLAAGAAEFGPAILSTIGAFLPTIIDAFRSGKSPEAAAKDLAPKYQEMRDRLVGSGIPEAKANEAVQAALQQEAQKAGAPEEMNPWMSLALMTAGGIAGHKLGSMVKGKYGTTALKAAKEAGHEAKLVAVDKRLADEEMAARSKTPAAPKSAPAPVAETAPVQTQAPVIQGPFPGMPTPKTSDPFDKRPGPLGAPVASGPELQATTTPFPGLPQSNKDRQNETLLRMVRELTEGAGQEAAEPPGTNDEDLFRALAGG
jgi:hypothetical protein